MNKSYLILIILILLLAGGLGYYWWQKNKTAKITSSQSTKTPEDPKALIAEKIGQITPPLEIKKSAIPTKDFYHETYKVSLQYPESWSETDLGGDKNVTTALTRENIAFFYPPESLVNPDNPNSAIVSVKLIRFVIEDEITIKTQDDWLNYIQKKVDEYVADSTLSANYKLEKLANDDKINKKMVVVEDYTEDDLITGRDYYIYTDNQLFQFVTKAPKDYYDKYAPYLETIVSSFKIQ